MYHNMPFHCAILWHNHRAKRTLIFSYTKFYGIILQKKVEKTFICQMNVYFQNIMLCAFFICERRFEFLLEEYWQNWQEKGFSPVCIMICLLMPCVFFIILGQNGHPYCPAPSFMGSFCKKSRQNFYLQNVYQQTIIICIFQLSSHMTI